MSARNRIAAVLLTVSLAGVAAWQQREGFTSVAIIPTRGDVPTVGHGSTRYEDGTRVQMGDTITRQRADALSRNLLDMDAKALARTLPGVSLYQVEFDLYLDWVGQYGIGRWRTSSMRRELIAGNHRAACQALLLYKYSAGFDCSTPGNRVCSGVWSRQLERHAQCIGAP